MDSDTEGWHQLCGSAQGDSLSFVTGANLTPIPPEFPALISFPFHFFFNGLQFAPQNAFLKVP